VALVIVGHRLRPAPLERQSRLGPVKRLNLVCAAYAPLIFGLRSGVLWLERMPMSSPRSPG
jgi:hypothetical protein